MTEEPNSVVITFASGASAFEFFMRASKLRDDRPESEIVEVLLVPQRKGGPED